MKALYYRAVPQRIRNHIGFARRSFADQIRRAITRPPLPPGELLTRIQGTPFLGEYLEVGRRSAESISQALESCGIPRQKHGRVLDFGCGPARTIRHFRSTEWELHGCDVDEAAIEWAAQALPFVRFRVNARTPPLPYEGSIFDAVFAVSLFTHFPPAEQSAWAEEISRILKRGGIAVVSTMGPPHMEAFKSAASPESRSTLAREGFAFVKGDGPFNSDGAFHTLPGLTRFFSPRFELVARLERGLDGFQDLTVFRRT